MAKRAFDLTVAGLGLLVLSPLLLGIAAAVRLSSRGPVLFRQQRVGKGGETFLICKFRTMRTGGGGREITVAGDSRITPVGRFLRKWKLDELPQLLNVVRGEMSLVGPRPEVPRYVALYDERQRQVLQVRPGITDLASIEFRDENERLAGHPDPEGLYVEEIMPRKLELNLEYVERSSLPYDLRLIWRTLVRVLRPERPVSRDPEAARTAPRARH